MADPTDPDLGSNDRRYSNSFKNDSPDEDLMSADRRFGDALRNAGPSILKSNQPIFGGPPPQRPIRTQDEVRRTDFSNGSVVRQPPQSDFPEDINAEVTQVAGTRQITPFFVTQQAGTGINTGQTVLKIYPGKIASIVPMVNGVTLDTVPAPQQSIHAATTPFSLFLKAKIAVDTDNLFRSAIGKFPPTSTDNGVKVCTDNDADVVPDIDPGTGEVPELKIFWEDPPNNTKGHFYLKLADITVDGTSKVTAILQWLFSSYSTFVATGSEVVIIV